MLYEVITVRFAEDDSAEAMAKLIDDKTAAVFCESIGNPAGNIVDIEALADMAEAHGVPLIVDNTVATVRNPNSSLRTRAVGTSRTVSIP